MEPKEVTCRKELEVTQVPFLTNPTACTGEPVVATIYMDSWEDPGTYNADGTTKVDDGKWASATLQSPPVPALTQESPLLLMKTPQA